MKITSDFKFDMPAPKDTAGSYEWWYFDAADDNQEWHIVVIFYDGCPFSTRYNKAWAAADPEALPWKHPAITISLYYKGRPVFYSMSEYPPDEAVFSEDEGYGNSLRILIGRNELLLTKTGSTLRHELRLDESLPSGDALRGSLLFESEVPPRDLFGVLPVDVDAYAADEGPGHGWNLTQPRAKVEGRLTHTDAITGESSHFWNGTGYHDHNLGREPMKMEFRDWYWGRIHFPKHTLVYYLMNAGGSLSYKGWLLDGSNSLKNTFESGSLGSFAANAFLLRAARTIELKAADGSMVMLQHSQLLDSGPFYYRFLTDGLLNLESDNKLVKATGIGEYIRPERIHNSLYWPLVHMRYRYTESPHWVQRSPTMYRWTW
ncbi:MAG: hypothetical protein LAT75_15585 [Candidatus Cyclonatronum sp.]|uniref:hypothetical protein n=1 Tax=Cyclonatronum sp. TaxID=3024185 RepID=UPI0025C5F225|nr:hypothetical protein [Cyclonatronum sp.]MCH8488282.1 hypothetical protein [Cyclonatronum sp.]